MSQFDLLRTKRFWPLFYTQLFGALNDNIYKNALVIFIAFTLAAKVSVNSSILVIIAGGIFILPFFLFSAFAGQVADRFEKSCLIRRIKIAEILIMCLATVGFLGQSLIVLMTVLFLMGAQSTFFGPLKYGILPQHLQPEELTGGNGLVQMGTYLAILGGTMIGGILVAAEQRGPVYVSVTVISVAVLGWYVSRNIPLAIASDETLVIDWNIFRQTYRIVSYSMSDKAIFMIIIAISWFWYIGATFLSLVPGYTRDVLSGNEHVATLLLTAFSIGIGTGSLLCEKLSRGRIEPGLVPIGAIGLSLFSLDLFFIGIPELGALYPDGVNASLFLADTSCWRILVDLVLVGLFGGIYIVPLFALLQHRADPHHCARVIAATNILNALFMVGSAVITTLLIQQSVPIPTIFLIMAVTNLVITGLIFIRFREFPNAFTRLITSWIQRETPQGG